MNNEDVPPAHVFTTRWKKAARSQGENACVEVASAPGLTGVRDSKQGGRGPVLAFERETWEAFLGQLKTGLFDAR